MTQVKIFHSVDKATKLETEINEWLSNHVGLYIQDIKWSVSESDTEDWSTSLYSALVIYTVHATTEKQAA